MKFRRIALVSNSCWNIFKFRLNLISKLNAEKHEVYVIAPLDEFISYKEQVPGVKHIPLNNLSRDNTNPFKDLQLLWELNRIYKRIQPDIVVHYTHKPNIYGAVASRMNQIPSVGVVTGLGYAFLHRGIVNRITKVLYKLACKFHRKTIFENEDDLKLFIELRLLNEKQGISIKGCGVDTEVYKPQPGHKVGGSKTVFTFIGRLLYDKGIEEFVQAARIVRKEINDVEFWVAGDLDAGNPSMISRHSLLQWIEGGTINYLGFVDDIRDIIQQSDCIVLPSYREGMPRVILEAMAMAKPVITTNVAGCRETVDEGENGFLVEVKDKNSLADAIIKMYRLGRIKREEMGDKGREKAILEFNSEKIAKELYEIISQVYFCAK